MDWNRAARLGDLKILRRESEDLCSHSLGFIFFFFAAKHARYQIRACPDRTSLRASAILGIQTIRYKNSVI